MDCLLVFMSYNLVQTLSWNIPQPTTKSRSGLTALAPRQTIKQTKNRNTYSPCGTHVRQGKSLLQSNSEIPENARIRWDSDDENTAGEYDGETNTMGVKVESARIRACREQTNPTAGDRNRPSRQQGAHAGSASPVGATRGALQSGRPPSPIPTASPDSFPNSDVARAGAFTCMPVHAHSPQLSHNLPCTAIAADVPSPVYQLRFCHGRIATS